MVVPPAGAGYGAAGLRARRRADGGLSDLAGAILRVRRPRHDRGHRHKIDNGEIQLYCLDSVDAESWYNRAVPPALADRASRAVRELRDGGGAASHPPEELESAPGQPGGQLWRLPCREYRPAPSGPVYRVPVDERRLRHEQIPRRVPRRRRLLQHRRPTTSAT